MNTAAWRFLLVAALLFPSLGCQGDVRDRLGGDLAGTSITFSVEVADEEMPALRELIEQFERTTQEGFTLPNVETLSRYRRPSGITVNLVSLDAAALDKELERHAKRPAVQLFAHDNIGLWRLVEEHLVQDLSDFKLPEGVTPIGVPPLPRTFGNKQFFLPFRPNVRLTYVNREELQRLRGTLPPTVEGMAELAKAFKGATGEPRVSLSLGQGDPVAVTVSEWILAFGGDPFHIGDAGSVAAFTFLQGLWKEGLVAPRESLAGRYDTELESLREGRIWLAENWSYTSAVLASEGLLKNFDVYAGWQGPAGQSRVVGGNVLGIPAGVEGKERAAALELADFLLSRQAQEYLVLKNAWPSVRDDVYDHVPKDREQTVAAVRAALKRGWYRPMVSNWGEVEDQMEEAVRRILLSGEPVKPVLGEISHRKHRPSAADRSGVAVAPSG